MNEPKNKQQEHAWLEIPEKPTVLDLDKIVERCLREALEARRFLKPNLTADLGGEVGLHKALLENVDFQVVSEHVAKSIIGELYELEIIRKLAPMFRMVPQLQNDFGYLDSRLAQHDKLRNLRKEP